MLAWPLGVAVGTEKAVADCGPNFVCADVSGGCYAVVDGLCSFTFSGSHYYGAEIGGLIAGHLSAPGAADACSDILSCETHVSGEVRGSCAVAVAESYGVTGPWISGSACD